MIIIDYIYEYTDYSLESKVQTLYIKETKTLHALGTSHRC